MRNLIDDAIKLVCSMQVPMTIADPDLRDCPIIYANSAFEDLTGFSSTWSVGKNCRFLQGEKTDKTETIKIRNAVEKRLSCVSALTNFRFDGLAFNNLLMVNPIFLKNGKCLLVGCQFRFEVGIRSEAIRQAAGQRQQMMQQVSGSNRDLAAIQRDTLKMRGEAAIMKVRNYLLHAQR